MPAAPAIVRARRALGGVAAVLLATALAVLLVGGLGAARVWWSVEPRAAAWRERAELPGELLYVALGDSTAQGIGSSRVATSYVGRLASDLEERRGASVRVVNLSVSGARVADVVAVQLPALRSLLADSAAPALVTLTVGANDAGRTDPVAFRASLGDVLDALPAGSYVADVPDFGGGPRLAAARELSAVVREEVAARPGLRQVALEEATVRMGWDGYAGDYFHPSDAGYARYARAFREAGAGS